jgi:hypothetical protein
MKMRKEKRREGNQIRLQAEVRVLAGGMRACFIKSAADGHFHDHPSAPAAP